MDRVLKAMDFPQQMIDWIMTCISTPYYSVSLKGKVDGCFKGGKDLRQGDPISPYIFILVMKAFSNVLDDHIQQGEYSFHPKCQQLSIT